MQPFEYVRPPSLHEAMTLLGEQGEEAGVLAGGTALVLLLKQRLFRPKLVIDIKGIQDLSYIIPNGGSVIRIGALATHHEIEASPLIRERFPFMAKMAGRVANVRIRSVGTLGGSLCFNEPASDPGTVLTALDARVKLAGPEGERILPLNEFFVDYYTTVRRPNELLTEIQVPNLPPHSHGLYYKFTPRSSGDKPTIGVAIAVTFNPGTGTCQQARIALGNSAPVPIRAPAAEQLLAGQALTDTLAEEAGRLAAAAARPNSDIRGSAEYRREMIRVLVRRGLKELAQRAQQA